MGPAMALWLADDSARELLGQLGWRDAAAAIADPRGWTVRCTPRRRTVLQEVGLGQGLFKKLRDRGARAARAEWHWLHELRRLGFPTVDPVCCAIVGRDSLLVTKACVGPSGDAWLARALDAVPAAIFEVAPMIARLHALGLCYRDLYWNHLVREPGRCVLLDVERVFAPRLFRSRWFVKDLAGLMSSLPLGIASRTAKLRFLRAYQGGRLAPHWKAFARAVLVKAARIKAHRPKYG